MDYGDEHWKKELEKFKIVQKCPKCNEIGLKNINGRIMCSNCGFEQKMREI